MKALKQGFKLIKYNISSVFLFEIIYKLITTAVFSPIMYSLLLYSLKVAKIDYLNMNNIGRYFTSPFTYLVFFIILIMISVYVMVQMSGLIYAYEESYNDEKTNAIVIFLKAIFNSVRVIRPRNMMFSVYVLFILPFTYTLIISASIAGLRLPDYFESFILNNRTILAIIIVVYGTLSIYCMMRIFSLNFFTLYRMGYRDAVRESKVLIKKNVFKVFAGVILLNVAITLLLFAIEWLVVSGAAGILKNIVSYRRLEFVLHTVIQISFTILYIIFSIISTPIICAYICGSFYVLGGEDEEVEGGLIDDSKEKNLLKKRRNKVITVFVIITGVVLNGLYLYLDMNKRYKLTWLYNSPPAVTAHRGDSAHAPENTMAAIKLAVENQADIIEIDVRQTKDGHFVLMHDENLKRTTGRNIKIGEVDYAFIKELDPGALFSEKYRGERIPTLEEVLSYASEEGLFLNIELKTAPTDTNYIEGVLKLISKYEMEDNCVVASKKYSLLQQIKSINPDIKTVLLISMIIGKLTDLEDVDIYSIRHNFITSDIVREAHRAGKKIYAWTVNREDLIKKMMQLDVDSIITDKPYTTKEIIYSEDESMITDLLKNLLDEY